MKDWVVSEVAHDAIVMQGLYRVKDMLGDGTVEVYVEGGTSFLSDGEYRDVTPEERRGIQHMYPQVVEPARLDDPVNSPSHYVYTTFEVIDVLDEVFPTDPHLWNAGKYLLRAKRKNNEVRDLKKAIKMIERRIARVEAETNE